MHYVRLQDSYHLHKFFLNSVYSNQFIEIIDKNINIPNVLAKYMHENNLDRQRAAFLLMQRDDINLVTNFWFDFVRLRRTYRIKIARSYSNEHIKSTSLCEVFIHPKQVSFKNIMNIIY